MVNWFNWVTFDIISDLLFGEPFGSLRDLATHKYIELLLLSVKAFRFYYVLSYFPWVKYLGSLVVDKQLLAARKEYIQFTATQTSKRMAQETQRPDFMTHIMTHNGKHIDGWKHLADYETSANPSIYGFVGDKPESALSEKEIESNCQLILTAGSETTATTLSGAVYLLCKNPTSYQKLKNEVRGVWKDYDDITLTAVNTQAPYLVAVLQESLRLFPPVATGFERRVGKGGEVVSGYYIPENTSLSVNQYPTNLSARNFQDAEVFVPERWMGDARYADDKRAVMQPFSFGPRACLGKVGWGGVKS